MMNFNNQNKKWLIIIGSMLCIVLISIPVSLISIDVNANPTSKDIYINDGDEKTRSIVDKDSTGIWITKSSMPTKRYSIGSAVVNNKIYVLGGWELNTNEVFDPYKNTWTVKSSMPHSHAYPGVAVVKNKIYVMGANEWGGDGNAIDVYDTINDSWITKKPMPFQRWGFGVGVVKDKIYVIGGNSNPPDIKENTSYYDPRYVLEYNPINESWTKKAPMPILRERLGVIVINNKIYAIGGMQGNETQVYDPATDNWTTRTPMLRNNAFFGIGVVNNKIHVVGGDAGDSEIHDVYDPVNDTWTEASSLLSGQWSLTVGVVNDRLFAIGGRLGSIVLNSTIEYYLNIVDDNDKDGIDDTWENKFGFNIYNSSDASIDSDLDGLTNLQEFLNSTNPWQKDTDGDNLGDSFEVIFSKTNPAEWDTNGNGIGDGLEFLQKYGYSGRISTLPNEWIGMTIIWSNYSMYVSTNSSVLNVKFDKVNKKLTVIVSGINRTTGSCNISIPKTLLNSTKDIALWLDDKPLNFTLSQNKTFYHIYVTYLHSTHELIADFRHIYEGSGKTPEEGEKDFPSYFYVLILFIIIIIIIIIVVIRVRKENGNNTTPAFPPEKLSTLLEKEFANGKMTNETYDDIKSLLEKYQKK
jgi:hypothetical protein